MVGLGSDLRAMIDSPVGDLTKVTDIVPHVVSWTVPSSPDKILVLTA